MMVGLVKEGVVIPESQGLRVGFWMLTLASWSVALLVLGIGIGWAAWRGSVQAGLPFVLASLGCNLLGAASMWLAVLERRKRDARAGGALAPTAPARYGRVDSDGRLAEPREILTEDEMRARMRGDAASGAPTD